MSKRYHRSDRRDGLEQGLLTAAQVRQALDQQRKKTQRFSEILCEMGFLKQGQIDIMLQQDGETPHRLLLGEALVLKGYINPETLDKELKEYCKESERVTAEISLAFSNLAHKNIVKTFTDLILMMFTQFGKQNIIIERCETGKRKSGCFVG